MLNRNLRGSLAVVEQKTRLDGSNTVSPDRFSTYGQSARIAGTGLVMIDLDVEDAVTVGLTAVMIRAQLDLLVRDDVFRSSKRSVAFLRYVVEQTLSGSASQIKERTIGVEVFGREPTYDTNLDHIVRTAATELRKRLAIYYWDEKDRSELRMG